MRRFHLAAALAAVISCPGAADAAAERPAEIVKSANIERK